MSAYRCTHCQAIVAEHQSHNCARESAEGQIDRLAAFIMENIEGEPSANEGAVDCAIRIMRATFEPEKSAAKGPVSIEQFTCATSPLAAERALRIIENGTRMGEALPDAEAIDGITRLCDEAGPAFARMSVNGEGIPF